MQSRNVVSWNVMISGYLKITHNPECTLKLFKEMVNNGFKVSHKFMVSVITACGRSSRLKEGRSLHGSFIRNFLDSNLILKTPLIDMYAKCQRGIHYFNQMAHVYNVKPQFAHYWYMASLYASACLIQEAEKLLKDFPGDGLLDLSMLLGGLLGSCRLRGELDLGERIALHLIDLEPLNVSRYTLLATIYGVAGRWEDTEKVKMMMKK
ncbi:hypothetical protein GIB67_017766 [Kingdonia uniflora]|uniref:Pentatricopeptide repeat-containing protein n=1 Tax=Kingdonia uniflora TaxID=39325 RepID=A0A7J7LQ45_9MAGN|nr:hypothetical protein GIB67_017766 [Kingdonia uniflora]